MIGLGVQFHDVPIFDLVLASDLLLVEAGLAPHARIAKRAREILVHKASDITDGLSMA